MRCLDTNFMIDLLKNDKDAIRKATEIKNDLLMTTEINVFEILFGIFKLKNVNYNEKAEQAQKLFDKLNIYTLERKSSFKSAQIAAQLIKEEKEIDQNDCLIAGISLANGCNTIVTGDKKHFSRITGLKIETY